MTNFMHKSPESNLRNWEERIHAQEVDQADEMRRAQDLKGRARMIADGMFHKVLITFQDDEASAFALCHKLFDTLSDELNDMPEAVFESAAATECFNEWCDVADLKHDYMPSLDRVMRHIKAQKAQWASERKARLAAEVTA